jgi:leucyl aminopeptidase
MLQLSVAATDPLQASVDLLAIPLVEDPRAGAAAAAPTPNPLLDVADQALGGALRQAMADEQFRGKPGQALVLHTQGRLAARRVMLIGRGAAGPLPARELLALGGRVARGAAACGARTAALVAPSEGESDLVLETLAEGGCLGVYRFAKYLTGERQAPPSLQALTLFAGANTVATAAAAAIARGAAIAGAVARARDLVNEPAGHLTPTRLAANAEQWARAAGVEVEVLGPAACRELGMGLFLAVAQGSAVAPRFINLAGRPTGARRRIVLVGKGVTFDSGGLSLKTNEGMLDMKVDMAGAAAALTAGIAAAEERLPIEVHVLAACTENMPSGTSYKLGDVLTSMAGKTVEINNTDAEGRLTLADALTFGLRLRPDAVIDLATLTGACMVALGPHTAGVMSNHDALAAEWLAAAARAGEDMWRLPLPPRLGDQLKSEVADMRNTGERWGGALTAGLFLKEFVGDVPWVHVDIAGPASADKEYGAIPKGGTGFAVSTIVEYLTRA